MCCQRGVHDLLSDRVTTRRKEDVTASRLTSYFAAPRERSSGSQNEQCGLPAPSQSHCRRPSAAITTRSVMLFLLRLRLRLISRLGVLTRVSVAALPRSLTATLRSRACSDFRTRRGTQMGIQSFLSNVAGCKAAANVTYVS